MRAVRVVLQLVISFVITATVMPAILVAVPAARESTNGIGLVAGILAVSFLLVWRVWPRSKS